MDGIRGRAAGVVLAMMVLGGCAAQQVTERREARLAQVQALAGEPVESIRYHRMYRWEALSDRELLLWTRQNEVWLLSVLGPCNELPWAQTLRVDAGANQLRSGFDSIRVRQQRCRIQHIRPVDVDALRALSAPAGAR